MVGKKKIFSPLQQLGGQAGFRFIANIQDCAARLPTLQKLILKS